MRVEARLLAVVVLVGVLCMSGSMGCGNSVGLGETGSARATVDRAVEVWKVGAPNEDSLLTSTVPPSFVEQVEAAGKELTVKTSTAGEFAYELAAAFRQGSPPDLVAGDNWLPFDPLFQEPSLEDELVYVTNSFDGVGGVALLFRSSPNFELLSDLALVRADCSDAVRASGPPAQDMEERFVEIGRAYLEGSAASLRPFSDPDRMVFEEPESAPDEASTPLVRSIGTCEQWGNDRLAFAHIHAAVQGGSFVGQSDVLLILRKDDGSWRLLNAQTLTPGSRTMLEELHRTVDGFAAASTAAEPAAPAVLVAPDDGVVPRPGERERYGRLVWRPSESSHVVAEIVEVAWPRETLMHTRFRADQAEQDQVSWGGVSAPGQPWKWRVWSVTDAGVITFSEQRGFFEPGYGDAAETTPPTISGRVTAADTGEPLPRAHVGVRLIRGESVDGGMVRYLPLGPPERMPTLMVFGNVLATDPWGRYVLGRGFQSAPWEAEEHIPAGTVVELVAWEPGYCAQDYGRRFEFEEGEAIEDVDFRLEPGCSISGRVVDADTGEPLAGAQATLTLSPDPMMELGRAHAEGGTMHPVWMAIAVHTQTTTDEEGRYVWHLPMGGLPSGTRISGLTVSQAGYVDASPSGDPVGMALDEPRVLGGVDIRLERVAVTGRAVDIPAPVGPAPRLDRTASLTGRLLDETGAPVGPPGRFHVSALRRGYQEGRWKPVQIQGGSAAVGDDGFFKFDGLPPGEYYVAALQVGEPRDSTDKYVISLYPGTSTLSQARTVTLAAGQEVSDIEFLRTRLPTFAVTGRVVDANGISVGEGTVKLMTTEPVTPAPAGVVGIEADGSFRFPKVPVGDYRISALTGTDGMWGPGEMGSLPLNVVDSAIEGLEIATHPGAVVTGTVVMEGVEPFPREWLSIKAVPLQADPAAGWPGASSGRVEPDGRFVVGPVFGSPALRVVNIRPGWMLKAVLLDGVDITDTPVDFQTLENPEVRVILTDQVSGITGLVAGVGAAEIRNWSVIAFSQDRSVWGHAAELNATRLVRRATPDAEGKFEIVVPPGAYWVTVVNHDRDWNAPQTLDALQSRAEAVEVEEGSMLELMLSVRSGQ